MELRWLSMSVKLSKLTSLIGLAGPITGKKWASGTANSDGTGVLTVSGLAFTPTIIFTIQGNAASPNISMYVKNFYSSYQYVATIGSNYGTFYVATITSNGFTFRVSPINTTLTNVLWYAFE